MTNTKCEVNTCERISPDGGVCNKCVDITWNCGSLNVCKTPSCEVVLCDNCGWRASIGYMGGEGSAFFCCQICWPEVEQLHPSQRDYQAERKHDFCTYCRDLKSEHEN